MKLPSTFWGQSLAHYQFCTEKGSWVFWQEELKSLLSLCLQEHRRWYPILLGDGTDLGEEAQQETQPSLLPRAVVMGRASPRKEEWYHHAMQGRHWKAKKTFHIRISLISLASCPRLPPRLDPIHDFCKSPNTPSTYCLASLSWFLSWKVLPHSWHWSPEIAVHY